MSILSKTSTRSTRSTRLNPKLETLNFKLKPILGIADPAPFFSPAMLKLVRWIADYTCSPIEMCLKAAVPAAVLKPNAKPKELLFVEACAGRAACPQAADEERQKRQFSIYAIESLYRNTGHISLSNVSP